MIGTELGHFRVTARLGAGGMGEVYRAEDTRLGRAVAIKALPEAWADDPDRAARFEREARLLASLNHPRIGAIHGLEKAGGRRFLVLELVEGETLQQRLGRGPLPLDEAIRLGIQVAEALEAAHEKGVVHRDLKPANLMLGDDGVKVLDFGLARALRSEAPGTAGGAAADAVSSPTLTRHQTGLGVVMGTPAYMSPEQARGRPTDRRTDLWAFGVVLHEALTGRQLFGGETASDSVAGVLAADVDWDRLPAATPPSLRRLLERCLERDPGLRQRDAGDARLELLAAARELSEAPAAAARTAPPARWRAAVALAAAFAAGALGAAFLATRSADAPDAVRRFLLPGEPRNARPRLSPDGRRLAWVETTGVVVRDLDQLAPRSLPGTEGALMLCWSPDGEWVAFGTSTRLAKAPLSGGAPVVLARPRGPGITNAAGAAWLPDGTIVFASGTGGLFRVSSDGGDPEEVLQPRNPDEVDFHSAAPLPEGRGVVFAVHRREEVDTLAVWDGEERHDVLRLDSGRLFHAAWSPTGHLVFDKRQGSSPGIWAVRFDLDRLEVEGEPFLVATEGGLPDVGPDATLVYVLRGPVRERDMVWLADGVVEPIPDSTVPGLATPALSPEGGRVAYSAELEGNRDVWVLDLERGGRSRLSFDPDFDINPVWLPDGSGLLWNCGTSICQRSFGAAGQVRRVTDGFDGAITPDGRTLLFTRWGAGTRIDLWTLPLAGGRASPLLATPFEESGPRVSPGGDLLAYVSDESGRDEVMLRRFPEGSAAWHVSVGGGAHPRWSANGNELYYFGGNELRAVPIRRDPEPSLGPPRTISTWNGRGFGFYDVAPDGRLLALRWTGEGAEGERGIAVVEGWLERLADRRAP